MIWFVNHADISRIFAENGLQETAHQAAAHEESQGVHAMVPDPSFAR